MRTEQEVRELFLANNVGPSLPTRTDWERGYLAGVQHALMWALGLIPGLAPFADARVEEPADKVREGK